MENIVVLDLADECGSFCSKLLADLGATVIKVERPEEDPSRGGLPFFYHNTNKLGVALDLETREGKRDLRRLLERADVLVETLQPGRMEVPDLADGRLRRINPYLIHISITGFGRTGPKRAYRCCDSVASASGGQMFVSGVPSGRPVKLFGSQSCYTASLFGANAALLGLRKRKITGRGCHIDLSIQEAVASTLDHVMIDYLHDGKIAGRQNPNHADTAFSALPCKDGYIQISILRNWETLLELMASEGKAGHLLERKWRNEAYREKHFEHIIEAVGKWTAGRTRQELFQLGQAMQFPWAPIASPREVLKSPQLKALRFFCPLPRRGRRVTVPGLPCRFSSFSSSLPRPAPSVGRHTRQVLENLGAGRKRCLPSKHSVKSGNILKGIRVIDLTRMLSGPYATRILGDFGAEVIKVQSELTARGAERNDSLYFSAWNRNKRSISLNLDHPEARELLLELAAISDVVVENFSPRVMANWGLTYERLREIKPDLIVASISAMGHTGPWKNFVGFAPTFHALSGLIAATSTSFDAPVNVGHAYGDVIAGLYAALAILSSIEHRDATGEGQYIDLSSYAALCTLLGPAFMEVASIEHPTIRGQSCECSGAAPCGRYPCKGDDRWCVIAIFSEWQWRAFCRISGEPELLSERYSTPAGRMRNREGLDRLVSRWTGGHSAETIVRRLQKAGVAAGVVQNARDLARDRHLEARHFFTSLKHPLLGTIYSDRSALWPWKEKTTSWKAAPLLGEANHYVFTELLGHSNASVQSFVKKGIL